MFTILTAITVSVATRIVGTLVISSIMVLPVACALQLKKGFRKTVLYSMLFGVVFHIIGLFLAYYIGIKPGGTIILVGVFWFVLIGFIKLLTKQVKWIHQKGDKNDGHLYHFRFLGAGKTTFIQNLLKQIPKNEKVVIIENDFGEINFDASLLSQCGYEVKALNSGCICCSIYENFVESLVDIVKQFQPDKIS